MVRGPILRVVASVVFPFAALLTLYFFFSGHNNPGGGFIAGVLMSGAIALQYLAYGAEDVPGFLKLPYEKIVAVGLVIALISAGAPLAAGYPFLTSFHATVNVPSLGAKMEFALAQLFDFGIFLLVAAGVMAAVLALAEDEEVVEAVGETGESPQSETLSIEREEGRNESPPSQSSSTKGEEEGVESPPSKTSSIEGEEIDVVEEEK